MMLIAHLWAHLWQSTLCAVVAALVVLALRRSPARTRHAIWLVASVKFLVPLSALVAAGRVLGAWIPTPPTTVHWFDRSLAIWRFDVVVAPAATSGPPIDIVRAFIAAWICGILVLAARRIVEWRRVSAVTRQACLRSDGREAAALRRAAERHSGAPPMTLVEHPSRIEPGVVGIVRPTLVWPAGLGDRLTDSQLDAIMSHEACHVGRHDNLAALVQVVVETVFWFHPLIWWIGARLVDERERACDEEVLEMGTDNRSYAEGIVNVCRFCLRAPATFVAGVGGSHLTDRIEGILTWRAPLASWWTRLLPLLLALVAAGVPLAAGCASTVHGAGQKSDQVYKPGKDVTPPVLVSEAKPNYTRAAMQAKIQGGVNLEVIVLKDGTVGDVKVVKSLDTVHGLDDEAVKAMKQWRFKPGTRDKKPVAVQVDVEMTFTLK